MSSFNVLVKIFDNSGLTLLTLANPFIITLSLSNSGTFSGTVSSSSTSGICQFSSLKITTSGIFSITASSQDKLPATSNQISISELALTTINLSSSESSQSANFEFSLTITLKDQVGSLWQVKTLLSLTSDLDLNGDINIQTDKGSIIANLWSSKVGLNTITVVSGLVSTSISITILKDMIKIIELTPIVFNI